MWKQKIGISLGNSYGVPTEEVVKTVAAVGFEAVSPEWTDKKDITPVIEAAKECGLAVQSLHAPYGKSAAMWSEDKEKYEPAISELLTALADCHRFQIPILVMHTWIGFDNIPEPTACGIEHFRTIVEKAHECGIQIAFENTEGEEHLTVLMDAFASDNAVGFCWDSGHEMCYNFSHDLLGRYGARLIMTHLNDNLGISRADGKTYWTDDLHLLPWDGVADWDYNIKRLQSSAPLEYINFELTNLSKPNRHENDKYTDMSLERYFTEAYIRACRVAYRLAR